MHKPDKKINKKLDFKFKLNFGIFTCQFKIRWLSRKNNEN
ncbi:hypothetical protein B808_1009 [Fructilactobacillus florum 8D]|uniref:Uncharacterized protein n=1 Tax=Fructilactobacillus florum 8D TaxID=1221538 RepID=W9EK92_9LACO|nr:hypothetical protein B807_139 [Fructilactobacillus florum 2F]ETO40104.1 hypothetical protein B808_1009 [Fructilactobacillus florum 8D]